MTAGFRVWFCFLVIITLSLYENCPVVLNLILWLTIQKYELVSCEKSVSFPYSPSLVPTAFPGLWNLVFSFLYILPVFLYENTSKQIWILFPLFLHECVYYLFCNLFPFLVIGIHWRSFLISRWRASSFFFMVVYIYIWMIFHCGGTLFT